MIPVNILVSIVVVVIYVPVLILAVRVIVSSNDPLGRWRSLFACILYRLAGSALFIPLGLAPMTPAYPYLYMLCFTLDVYSSWALTVCTAYLINIADEGEVTQHGSSSVSGHHKKSTEALRLPSKAIVIVIIPSVWAISFVILDYFSIRGGAGASTALLYIAPLGPVVIVLLFFTVVGYAVRTWFRFERMLHYRKRLLVLITVTLPLIAVRAVYGILNVFSPVTISATRIGWNPYTDKLAVFSMFMFEGSPIYYSVMDVLMECVVVIIYTVAGTMLPLDEDYRLTNEYPFLRLQHLGDMENQL